MITQSLSLNLNQNFKLYKKILYNGNINMGNSQSSPSQNSGVDLNQAIIGAVLPIRSGALITTMNSQRIPEKKEEESIQLIDQTKSAAQSVKKRPPI
jgi:hypothetical protein